MKGKAIWGKILKAIIPALITGFLFYFLVAMTQGMDKIDTTSIIWFWVGFILFGVLFVFVSKGEKILGRFFKYLAYELWASPVFAIIYAISVRRIIHQERQVALVRVLVDSVAL